MHKKLSYIVHTLLLSICLVKVTFATFGENTTETADKAEHSIECVNGMILKTKTETIIKDIFFLAVAYDVAVIHQAVFPFSLTVSIFCVILDIVPDIIHCLVYII